MIESLLSELASLGWTISWAFQYAPAEWRMSIIREEDIGGEQGTYLSVCAFAPTFAEALEDCLANRADAKWEPLPKPEAKIEAKIDLRSLGLARPQPKIVRRI